MGDKTDTHGEPGSAAEQSDLQAQFLASLNHEIRTPLTGILGMTDLLLETNLDSEQKEYVETARLCAEQLLDLFNKTLEYSEILAGLAKPAMREYHLPETIRGAVSDYSAAARAKGLRLICRLAPALPAIAVGDAPRLRRIVGHLVENAVKFTERGRVEVSAAVLTAGGKPHLHLTVRDTGIGIPSGRLGEVFDSFRQLDTGLARRYNGLGLGLSLVKALTRLMGGSIQVTSQPGAGSTFSVVLPLETAPSSEAGPSLAETAVPDPSVRRRDVLVVEDQPLTGALIARVLKREGYAVALTSSGPQAVRAAARRRFDLVVISLELAVREGFETVRHIRDLPGQASVAVVAVAARADDRNRRLCFENGMQGFLARPVKARELAGVVAGLLR